MAAPYDIGEVPPLLWTSDGLATLCRGQEGAARCQRGSSGRIRMSRNAAGSGRRRPAGVHGVPLRALAEAAQHQPVERLNREIARRGDVVGIYPNDAALIRL